MRYAWFSFILGLCFVEFWQSGGFSHMAVLLAILLLKAHADVAAENWMRMKVLLKEIPRPWVARAATSNFEETNPPPFQKPRIAEPISLDEARKRRASEATKSESKKFEEKQEPKTAPKIQPKTDPKLEPKTQAKRPNFSGPPHEILAIELQSPTGQIVNAFRHWMKIYHPDHSQEQNVAQERARKIIEAKEAMLERRRKLRKSA